MFEYSTKLRSTDRNDTLPPEKSAILRSKLTYNLTRLTNTGAHGVNRETEEMQSAALTFLI